MFVVLTRGVELLTDMLAYGFIIGAISLSSFVLVTTYAFTIFSSPA